MKSPLVVGISSLIPSLGEMPSGLKHAPVASFAGMVLIKVTVFQIRMLTEETSPYRY